MNYVLILCYNLHDIEMIDVLLFQVGTLDVLVGLSDELGKLDAFCERFLQFSEPIVSLFSLTSCFFLVLVLQERLRITLMTFLMVKLTS